MNSPRHIIRILAIGLSLVAARAVTIQQSWVQYHGSPVGSANGGPMAVDKSGNIFVVGNQGFTARFSVPAGTSQADAPMRADVQFLRPEVALPHFPGGAAFSVLEGRHTVATGEVITVWGAQ